MTDCTVQKGLFGKLRRRRIEASFEGGEITSDAGLLLLRQTDRHLGLLDAAARVLKDDRDPSRCEHSMLEMLRQRVYGIAQGYEDLNDHDRLRHDLALTTALSRDRAAASSPTLCRFENGMDRATAVALHGVLVEQFVASFKSAPEELILDFDATDDPVHGNQEGRYFHGYYDGYCFLPLYVTCGEQLLVSYLRPSCIDAAAHSWAILALLVKRLRRTWPQVKIIFRGDSGFCRHQMLSWCERRDVGYIVGIAKNDRLLEKTSHLTRVAKEQFEASHQKQRNFGQVAYAAQTWDRARRVIVKAEHTAQGSNPRFVVTNLEGDPQALYDKLYCARGEMENRIKEQMQLFADRTSCHQWWPNQFRVLLSSLAYTLIEAIRRVGLHGTSLARAQVSTLRLKLLKIGALIVHNTRRIRFLLPKSCPEQALFFTVAQRFKPSG